MEKQLQIFKKDVLRYPRLDTVLMVEETAQKSGGDFTVRQLWQKLPKKTMWQTYLAIIDYLEYSGKVYIGKDGAIVWIWNPKLVQKYMNRPELSWGREK